MLHWNSVERLGEVEVRVWGWGVGALHPMPRNQWLVITMVQTECTALAQGTYKDLCWPSHMHCDKRWHVSVWGSETGSIHTSILALGNLEAAHNDKQRIESHKLNFLWDSCLTYLALNQFSPNTPHRKSPNALTLSAHEVTYTPPSYQWNKSACTTVTPSRLSTSPNQAFLFYPDLPSGLLPLWASFHMNR